LNKQLKQADEKIQDDLIALVAGNLSALKFEHVVTAVANNSGLQQRLKHLELIHAGILRNLVPANDSAAALAETTAWVLARIAVPMSLPLLKPKKPSHFRFVWPSFLTWFRTI
jgi:hypothetical protein